MCLKIHQIDVNNTFFNALLDVIIYLKQSERYKDKEHPDWVCKLVKGLYGLKQVSRIWHTAVHKLLTDNRYMNIEADPCIYILREKTVVMIFLLHIDDMGIAATEDVQIEQLCKVFNQKYAIKINDKVEKLMGLHLDCTEEGITIWQETYIKLILQSLKMETVNLVGMPIAMGDLSALKLSDSQQLSIHDIKTYQTAVGKLNYATGRTRPDLAFTQHVFGRYNSNSTKENWHILKHVLRYLADCVNLRIIYS